MEKPAADVDVLIPAYNSARTIGQSIASILQQTLRDLRVVVVNDGSTDDTSRILAQIASGDPRLCVIDQANGGIVDALNAGLRACTAEIVARLDADDVAAADRLERQLAFLRDHPDYVAVSGAVTHINDAGHPIGPPQTFRSPDLADPYTYPQREPYLVHPFLMARRSALNTVGGYRYVFHAEDTDLYWRLQEHGRLFNMPDMLGLYRMHDDSISASSVINGRIAAVCSQLCGISAIRRRSGRPDIEFPRSALAEYQQAGTLERIVAVASRGLEPAEARRLAISACAKLLELAGYRPYELDAQDWALIRDVLVPELSNMPHDSRAYCERMLSGAAARLALAGNLSVARKLTPTRLYPVTAAKLAYRALAPVAVRRVINRAVGRAGVVK